MSSPSSNPRSIMWYLGWGTLAVAFLSFIGAAGVVVVLLVESRLYYWQYEKERDLITPIIASETKFSRVSIHRRSNGGIALSGDVASEEDLLQLKSHATKKLGEQRGQEATRVVLVKHRDR